MRCFAWVLMLAIALAANFYAHAHGLDTFTSNLVGFTAFWFIVGEGVMIFLKFQAWYFKTDSELSAKSKEEPEEGPS